MAGYKDFTDGSVLTADEVDGYLMRQALMVFATTAARDSALSGVLAEGMTAYMTDTNQMTQYNGSAWVGLGGLAAWTSYTPTVNQGPSTDITKTIGYSKYIRFGSRVRWSFAVTMTAGGTATNAVRITLPITAAAASGVIGFGAIYDASTTTVYSGVMVSDATTDLYLTSDGVTSNAGWGFTPNLALASGDQITGSIEYEV